MLWLISKRTSLAASVDRIASFVSITCFAMVRLTRIVSSLSSRRSFVQRGTRTPLSLSIPTKPRSACTKIRNKLSNTSGRTVSSDSVLLKLRVISTNALSLASALAASSGPLMLERTSSFDMIIEPPESDESSSTMTARKLESSELEGVCS